VLTGWAGCRQTDVFEVSPKVSGSNSPGPVSLPDAHVGDGIYLVPDNRPAGTKRVDVPFADREELDKLSLPLVPDVPIDLADAPVFSALEDGRQVVLLHFTDGSAREIEQLTEKYKDSDRRIAVVIGGEVISRHKFRSTISDGRIQISCCNPSACERLKLALP
ncbi:MAG TPA: hypothetical protein VM285_16075, partial [Polyangia bacterium]|nr:hypothetical protein [Polyangia bacterium]